MNFLFWDERSLLVLDTGNSIYLIEENLHIRAYFEITTPLIGLYLINKDNLLLLEEAVMRVVDSNGGVLKHEVFDLIQDFSIQDNVLSIQTSEAARTFKLT